MHLFFDTETTGIPRDYKAKVEDLENWPRVVQVAFLCMDGKGEEVAAREYLIRPEGFVIPKEAEKIHGISTARALAEGVAMNGVLEEFWGWLGKAAALVAHNISYDENVLGAEFLRAGMVNPIPKSKRVCTMQAGTGFCGIPGRYGMKWPTLGELHGKLFGEGFEDAHSALGDVRACARCYFGLRGRGVIK